MHVQASSPLRRPLLRPFASGLASALGLCAALTLAACSSQPDAPSKANNDDTKADAAKTATKTEAEAGEAAVDPAVAYALTPEEEQLIASDPATLTADQNRKRAQALRKRIMRNPESEAAKALEDLRRAALAGELTPPPAESRDPSSDPGSNPGGEQGLVFEAPDYMRGEPKQPAPQ